MTLDHGQFSDGLIRSQRNWLAPRCSQEAGNPAILAATPTRFSNARAKSSCSAGGFHFSNWWTAFLVAFAILLVFPHRSSGQELEGTFTGTVTDQTGALIPRATITIALNGVGGEARVMQSDSNGNYTATNLTAGTYSITVAAPGFETFTDKNVELNVAQKRAVNVQLKTGSETQTVIVQDNPVAIETASSAQAGTI